MAAQLSTTPSETKVCSLPLGSFLKGLIDDIDNSLQSANEEQLDFLKQCKEKCCHLLKSSQVSDISGDVLKQILQEVAHVVLEYTYQDEMSLVGSEFPADSVSHRLSAIQEQLDKICQVAKECFQNQTEAETLGEEVAECVHWRKGALFYMYCHTLQSDCRPTEPSHYRQCLEEGVLELEKMLSTRQPASVPADVSSDDTLQLFNHGVYSDTHLLAMMYAAELCYWHQQAVDQGRFSPGSGEPSAFSARRQGLRHLQSYLAAVQGPLRGQGWNTDRAEEFVQYFRQLTKD
ncbi:RAB7A-interacting MON1-CCZ1 complex subunit 1-like [Babylonia areolata]|uniref:RAB7A-interacting MON1-CCZ1 complex subunit 1-like n=1 Tax=Babylonia areolata TaxID=304850 RepID=UPI003FD4C5D5